MRHGSGGSNCVRNGRSFGGDNCDSGDDDGGGGGGGDDDNDGDDDDDDGGGGGMLQGVCLTKK